MVDDPEVLVEKIGCSLLAENKGNTADFVVDDPEVLVEEIGCSLSVGVKCNIADLVVVDSEVSFEEIGCSLLAENKGKTADCVVDDPEVLAEEIGCSFLAGVICFVNNSRNSIFIGFCNTTACLVVSMVGDDLDVEFWVGDCERSM